MGRKNTKQPSHKQASRGAHPKNDARGYSRGGGSSSCGGGVVVPSSVAALTEDGDETKNEAQRSVPRPQHSSIITTTTDTLLTATDVSTSSSLVQSQPRLPQDQHVPQQIPQHKTATRSNSTPITLLLEDLFRKLQNVHDQVLYCTTTTASDRPNNPTRLYQPPTGSEAKLRARAQKLWHRLTELGFSPIQIESLVAARGLGAGTAALPEALDWLCGHYSDQELPPLFVDVEPQPFRIPDETTTSSPGYDDCLTVMGGPKFVTSDPDDTMDHSHQPCSDPELPSSFTACPSAPRTRSDSLSNCKDDGDDEKAAETKSWLLAQYAYERDDDDDDDDTMDDDCAAVEDCKPVIVKNTAAANDQKTTTCLRAEQKRQDRLDVLQRQLAESQADLNNEANNYMRSKSENKQLQKHVQALRQQLRRLEQEIERSLKQQQQQQHVATTKTKMPLSAVAYHDRDEDKDAADSAEDEDYYGGAFLFDSEQCASSCTTPTTTAVAGPIVASVDTSNTMTLFAEQAPTPPSVASSSGPSIINNKNIPDIPSDWTGQSPKEILEEYCRKEKQRFGRPNFQKLLLNGCRVHVPLVQNYKPKDGSSSSNNNNNCMEAVLEGPTQSYPNAQQYVSVQLLFQIIIGDKMKKENSSTATTALPLYRLFPPFYRSLWLSWLDVKQQEQQKHDQAVEQQRQDQIDRLVQLAAVWSATTTTTTTTTNGPSVTSNDSHGTSAVMKPTTTSTLSTWEDAEKGDDDNLEDATTKTTSTIPVRYGRHPTIVVPSRTVVATTPTTSGKRLRDEFFARRETTWYQQMWTERMRLPIYAFRGAILDTIQNNPVTILCAETGSGKTTQCCSYILEEALSEGLGDQISILCTQPRRVAAMSVAERVADELLTETGKLVGYQIRLEVRRTAETRLLFCTTGIVLRRLIEDPTLEGITHVVVDEVHERQWQIDVLLVALRALLNGKRPDLKIILMSATLDTDLFGSFFSGAPVINVPGRTFPVSTYYLEDLLEKTKHIIDEGSSCGRREYSSRKTVSLWVSDRGGGKRRENVVYQMSDHVSDDFPNYSMATRLSMDRVDETVLNYDLIEDVLVALVGSDDCPFKPSEGGGPSGGAVLVFLPGLGEIRALMERLSGSRRFGNTHKFEIIPMHSSLSSNDQRRAFKTSPAGCRKIIISTNIAETSITIPDVVFVIDSGRVREIQRDRRTGTRKLVSTWCARANAKQRAGRAGRVQPGVCLKLYSSRTELLTMKSVNEPELRRIPLEEVCLTILAGGFAESCSDFLSQTPQPPSGDSVKAALKILQGIGAVVSTNSTDSTQGSSSTENLTALGQHLAKLPVDVRVGKMLIYGTIFKCTDAMLTIAACLSASKSPFTSPFDDHSQAKAAHAKFSHRNSDFMTLLNVWNAYIQAGVMARKFCRDMFLNYSALTEIQDARTYYLDLLCSLGFIDRQRLCRDPQKRSFDESALISCGYCQNSRIEEVVHAVVCAGLFPNVAFLNKSTTGKETTVQHKSETLFVRSSVNSKVDARLAASEWLVFFEKFGTDRRVSISKTAFVSPLCLMIFGSDLVVLHTKRRVVVDGWIELAVAAKTAVMFCEIRALFDSFLVAVFEDSRSAGLRDVLHSVVESVVKLLVAEAKVKRTTKSRGSLAISAAENVPYEYISSFSK